MHRTHAAAIAVLATLVLAGCSGSEQPADVVLSPASATSEASLGSGACVGADQVSNRPDHATFCSTPR